MANIKEIFLQYPEEIIQNTLVGNVISGEIDWKNEPIMIQLEKLEFNQILFKYNEKPLRINFTDYQLNDLQISSEDVYTFDSIFWISSFESGNVEVKYLACGKGQKRNEDLDIGFGDNIIFDNRKVNFDELAETLAKDFVFHTSFFDLLFIQTYPGSNTHLTIYGTKKRAEIRVADNKWIVQKIVKKPFPKKHDDFLQLNVRQHNRIRFVESSKAKEAYETLQAEEARGNTLISLWEEYSAIELERSRQLKEKIGALQFRKIKSLEDGINRIKILIERDELRGLLNENKEDILSTALELKNAREVESSASKTIRFNIKNINNDLSFDLFDELNILPDSGFLEISVLGSEIVHKRRSRALKSLREDRRFITRNLHFAIEAESEAMLDKKRAEKPLTERTRKFFRTYASK